MSDFVDEASAPPSAEPWPLWSIFLPVSVLILSLVGQLVVVWLFASLLLPRIQHPGQSAPEAPLPSGALISLPLAVAYGGLILWVAASSRRRFGRPLAELPGFGPVPRRLLVRGALVGVGLYMFNLVFSSLIDVGVENTELFQSVQEPWELVPLAIAVIVLAPVFEELLFRGLFFHVFEPFGAPRAILGSAVLFAAVHFLPYAKAPLAVLPIFFVGLATGWLRATSGSIRPTIATHAVFNALGIASWAIHFAASA